MNRAEYIRETRKCISLQNETYYAVSEIKDILKNINDVFPFTDKKISQQDVVKYLCRFFLAVQYFYDNNKELETLIELKTKTTKAMKSLKEKIKEES